MRTYQAPNKCVLFLLILGACALVESEALRVLAADPSTVALKSQGEKSFVLSKKRVRLGKALFFDRRLSANGTVSCATCHDPASAFTSRDAVTRGVGNEKGTRNAPTLLNSFARTSYFWDGRAATLEEQAKQPLLNINEMGMETEAAVVERVSAIDEYRKSFRRVFPREGITLDTISRAIAAFERTLISRNSPFDRFLRGNTKAITERQKQGWELFKGRAKCADCHVSSTVSPDFSDEKFYNTGIRSRHLTFETLVQRAEELRGQRNHPRRNSTILAHDPQLSDLGRFLITLNAQDLGAFKTPTLRDIELTGPYMHDGSLRTLLDVVRFYNQGGSKNPQIDKKITPLNLNEEEMNAIVEFLRSLTSDEVLRMVQTLKPQTREAR
ncbi:MAG TPA: cytochrome c peroxidase [Candidatus Saccharimonadales bacterium]|nr:cytochrome c peroxidase [Candidatus Saccharimonadales bacterium]